MKTNLRKSFFIWLPFAALITFTCGLSYLLVQQNMRMNGNDPQVQVVGDIATALSQGATVEDIIPPSQPPVDMSMSLDPYVMIFNASGTALGSSAMLNGQLPTVPSGVFTYAETHGEDRFTWQPAPGAREAAIVDYVSGNANASSSFVLVGRSLAEVETDESTILHIAELAWILGLIVMFAIVWALAYQKKEI